MSAALATRSARVRAATLLGAFAWAALASSPAAAQEPVALDRATTDGVDRPIHDYSGEGDASSLELNPALIQATPGIDLVLMGYQSTSAFTRGTGFGLFTTLNLGLGFGFGLGVQALQPGIREVNDFDAVNNPNLTKLSLAFSGGDGEVASTGLGVHIPFAPGLASTPDIDVGLLVRMRNWASLGAMVRFGPANMFSAPVLQPGTQELQIAAELGVRPIRGRRWLELAGGFKARMQNNVTTEQLDSLGMFPRGRVAVRYHGVELAGEVEQVRVAVLDETTFQRTRYDRGIRGGVSLGLSWDFVGVRSGLHAGLSEGVDGFGIAARFSSTPRGRVYWPRIVNAERYELSDIRDERDLITTLQQLERAERAGERAVLLVDARNLSLGWASLEELRAALVRIRDAGGHVFAYLEGADVKDYYIASAAEQVFLHPGGELDIYGLKATSIYFKGALDKLGVNVQALHIDEYKSAHEPFTRTEPSPADREQREKLLADTYGQFVLDVAQARGMTQHGVRALVDDAPHGPEQAKERGLVDAITHRDEVIEAISSNLGAEVRFASFSDTQPEPRTWSTTPYIGVVLVEGTIVDGENRYIPLLGIQFTGGDTIAATLRQLRGDPACEGIILRVNSPGGSALASEIIWREVDKTRLAHEKDPRFSPPIVVSMGDVAASGGYYVATGARTVFASKTTITGSIGVVTMNIDISGLLEKLGISTTTFTEGANAAIEQIWTPASDEQMARLMASMRRVYEMFVQHVAEARGMTVEQVDGLARGHVYSGAHAHALKLVDRFGGMHEAIAEVRKQAKTSRVVELDLRVLPRRKTLLDLLLRGPASSPFGFTGLRERARARQRDAQEDALPRVLNAALSRLPLSILFLPSRQPSALMPAVIEIE
ncbi:MAG: signal peptide peptidase SppA [Myxococcales bacterium]|nr:signal peptide peptidase SppA [Myxococcales bacterium]